MKNLKQDYIKLFKHYTKKEVIEIEDINEILLSSEYYNKYGEYGIENFLKFYKNDFKKICLYDDLMSKEDLKPNKPNQRRKI